MSMLVQPEENAGSAAPAVAEAAVGAGAASLPVNAVVQALVEQHGEDQRERIESGVERVAGRWAAADGDAEAFRALCLAQFVSDPEDLVRLVARLETLDELLSGHLYEIQRGLRRYSDLRGAAMPAVDDLLATFDPSPALNDRLHKHKLAFVALLNLPRPTLDEMLREGAGWSDDEWAAARIAQSFGARVPSEVEEGLREAYHAAGSFVDGCHVPVGAMVDADGQRHFETGRTLILHWLVREQIKAGYSGPGGLGQQRALGWVMRRHVDGSLPRALMEGKLEGDLDWDPEANTIGGQPVGEDETLGPERYARWLGLFHAMRRLDAYHPDYPTAIARRFELAREIPEAEVEAILVDLLSAPVRADLARLAEAHLGRPLEAHDIYFEDLLPDPPAADLNRRLAERFPDHRAFEAALPALLRELGFDADEADFLGTRVQVEIARGAGHAMPPGMPEYKAWLRTNSLEDEFGWDGFDIAMHELGHNLEQLYSRNRVPRPALRGVPNNACTEAFAFLYQSLSRQVVGLGPGPGDPDPHDMAAIREALAACQIAGPGLVELYSWRWLYENPDADAPALRDAVIRYSREVWDRFYAEHFGPDRYLLMGAYQHMVGYPLYLPDYTLGHVVSHQIRSHVRGRDLAAETKRICSIGRLTPDLWMRRAVGEGIRAEPLMRDAAEAVARIRKA